MNRIIIVFNINNQFSDWDHHTNHKSYNIIFIINGKIKNCLQTILGNNVIVS